MIFSPLVCLATKQERLHGSRVAAPVPWIGQFSDWWWIINYLCLNELLPRRTRTINFWMTFTWMAKEQVVCNLVKTFFRPVAALATVSASCVESLPFCRFFLLFHVSIGIISFNSLFVPLILCFNWYHFIQFILRSTHFMFQLVSFH